MKVKDILTQLAFEHPDAELIPGYDDAKQFVIAVAPPAATDESIVGNAEAERILGKHAKRIERIRIEVADFYGLPTGFKVNADPASSMEWVEMLVRSPSGKLVTQVDVSVDRVTGQHIRDGFQMRQYPRFQDADPDVTSYNFQVHKYVLTREELTAALKNLCAAPRS